MKLSEKSEVLLARYLLAVERRLPLTGRKDMIAEIRANLMDTLDDQYPPEEVLSEDKLEAELRKLGSPAGVASSYFGSDALIGPQHNLVFRLIVTRLVPIVAGALVIAGIVSFIVSGGKSPFWSLWELISNIWQVSIAIIGTAAVILIVLTRFFPQVNNENKALEILEEERKNWKVSDLPEIVQKTDKVQLWEPAFGIFFGTLWLVFWVFLFKQYGGLWWYADEKWRMVPVFTDAFRAFIPWIAINTGLEVLHQILLAAKGKRTILSRVIEIGITISQVSLVAAMLKAGELVQLDEVTAAAQGFPAEAISGIQMLLSNNFVHWFLVFLVVVLSLDLLSKLVQLVKRSLGK